MGWDELSAWKLPGPAKFLAGISTRVRQQVGAACILMPDPMPDGIVAAIMASIAEDSGARVIEADLSGGLGSRGPAHWLAAHAAVDGLGIRSAADFLDEPGLSGAVFIVHGIPRREWRAWSGFIRLLRAEATRDRMISPVILVIPPANVVPQEITAVFARATHRWQGRVGQLDTEIMVAQAMRWPDDDTVATRAAAACIVEVAGWNLELVAALSAMPIEVQLDPVQALRPHSAGLEDHFPTWENRLVDMWDGAPFVHALSLIARGREVDVTRRVWRSQVRILFPFLEQVRGAVARTYRTELLADGDVVKTYPGGTTTRISDPEGFEIRDMHYRLKYLLPEREVSFLWVCYRMRNQMAHMKAVAVDQIIKASQYWEENSGQYLTDCHGWDWPRCGQRLTVLVGPSGAGKSTWAAANCEPASVVSSDAIRQRIFGSLENAGDQSPVFEMLREETIRLLSGGRNAVIDATNLEAKHRVSNAMLAPGDMKVEYVVIDRPIEEKEATRGWRKEKPWLIAAHSKLFEESLGNILNGDALEHVTVRDLREANLARKKAS